MSTEAVLRTLQIERDSLSDCVERLRKPEAQSALTQALDHLHACLNQNGKIIVTGVGKSGKIAQKIASTLTSTGNLAVFLHPTEGLHGDLGIIRPNDIVLALSYSGKSEELLRLLPALESRRIPFISLVGQMESPLARASLVAIDVSVKKEACPENLAPTASTTLALAMGDAIAVALMERRKFNSSVFAENHPGGSLGKKLETLVKNLMHSGANVPFFPETTPMDEIVIASSEAKLGAVLIGSGNTLLGVITDGDIRRALKHREKFFTLKARDVMTQNPITVLESASAHEALRLMENRPSQISVLPVVDSKGHWKGLLRLHDIVQSL